MTWNYSPTITVNGTSYTNLAYNNVTVEYGRTRIFDYPRPGYARVDILNLNDATFPFAINDSLVIQVKNTSGVDKTIFTGIVTDVGGKFRTSETVDGVGTVTLTAVAPMAQMARTLVGKTIYPQETDAARIQRILTECGVTIDTIDAAIYTLAERPVSVTDGFTLSNNYAQSVLGSIYETADGKVGYANEDRRKTQATTVGFTAIPSTSVIIESIASNQTVADVMNIINVSYSTGSVTKTNTSSVSTYGSISGNLTTELVNVADAETVASTILNLRALPQTNLSSFAIRMLDPTLSNSVINDLISVYFGKPLSIANLPNAIYPGLYEGYVEGWNWSFNPANIVLSVKTSQEAYSYRTTRWQEVSPTLTWNGVAPTLEWENYD